MSNIQKKKEIRDLRRRLRTRAKVSGNLERPRLSVARSLNHIYAQIIEDEGGKTLIFVSDVGLKGDAGERKGKVARAYLVGKKIGEEAVKKNIKSVVFDRAHRKYHGRVKAVAEGARDGGLEF
jgi:large subunit ribosomal protein L18